MTEPKSQKSINQINKKNQNADLSSKIEYLEEQILQKEILLIHLEKLSSLGQFVQEIIHELKNPLTAISGFTELGKIAKTKNEREAYLNKIPKFINQISSRLSMFRSMKFNTGISYEKIDLFPIIAECLSTLELLKPKGAIIESSFKSTNLNIMGDAEQWVQVFLSINKTFFKYMKEIKSTLNVKSEILSSAELKSKNKEIDVSMQTFENWNKNIDKSKQWIKIIFENRKISIPKENIFDALNLKNNVEKLEKLNELGIKIACDIVQRHQGNIYIKKSKASGLSLHICVPKIN
jgi:signal transduction histidine kinase